MNCKIIRIKKNTDKRGWLSEILREDKIGKFKQVYVVTIKPGQERGNHYHKKRKEWFCVHTIKNIGKEDVIMVSGSSTLYDKKKPDTFKKSTIVIK